MKLKIKKGFGNIFWGGKRIFLGKFEKIEFFLERLSKYDSVC